VSVETVSARIAQLQSLLAGAPAARAVAPSSTSFAQQLAGASAGGGPATGAPVPTAVTAADWGTRTAAAPDLDAPTAAAAAPSLPASVPYRDLITAAARRHGVDPALLAGLIRQESGFNANAGSPAGAQGLTQLMPGTARGLGVTNPLDPAQSIEGGAKYLAAQLQHFGGDVTKALAAYNAGPGAVERFGGVPPYAETQAYVRRVQAYATGYRAGAGAAVAA
jgi:soluble lytic murein transglycosylase-like protein